MATEVILPKLGQTMEEGTVIEWFKQEGDEVKVSVEPDQTSFAVLPSHRLVSRVTTLYW